MRPDMAFIPIKYQKMYVRAVSGRSRKAAMRIMCLKCVGWSESKVEGCSDANCPLHPYRLTLKAQPPLKVGVQTI